MHRGWRRADQGYLHRLSPEELARGKALRAGRPEPSGAFTGGVAAAGGPALETPGGQGRRRRTGFARVGLHRSALRRPAGASQRGGRGFGFLGVDTDERKVEHSVSSASFEKLSRGRQRGQEDPSSFYRKGVAGDWRNYFSEEDRRVFKEEAGELLIRLGYEEDLDW